MIYNSCFDIIGPIMVGPSSSHTAGVVSIGKFVHDLCDGAPRQAAIVFYDSFAETYKGHGTDKAIVGGLLGMETDDLRIRQALHLAHEQGMHIQFRFGERCPFYDHPNTVLVIAEAEGMTVSVGGVSLGGGNSKIVCLNGNEANVPLNLAYDVAAIRDGLKPNNQTEARSEEPWIFTR